MSHAVAHAAHLLPWQLRGLIDKRWALIGKLRGRLALTPVTLALVGAILAVFAAMLWYGAGLWHSHNGVQLAWGASFGPATKDGEWWRLVAAMFLHFGLAHLAINLWALWDAGRLAERLYGSLRLFAIYVASGLAGNLLSLIAHGDDARINQRWQKILDTGRQEGASFEELAGRIEAGVTSEYEKSFEQPSALNLAPAAPSAATLEILKKYTQLRGDAFHALAEGLRSNDQERIREALEAARAAADQARGAEPPPDAAR